MPQKSPALDPTRHRHLPRLAAEAYKGFAIVHWIMGVKHRAANWLTEVFHLRFREILLHAATRYHLSCPTYCLMPDHIHMLWVGFSAQSDQRNGMRFFRQYLGAHLAPAEWQKQPYDHVLKEKERERNAFAATAFYVWENPVREGLALSARDYAFSGAVVPGYPDLNPSDPEFWDLYWRIHEGLVRGGSTATR